MDSSSESLWQLLNWVDVGLLLALLATFFIGLSLGLYRQVAILGSLVLGIVVASQVTAPLAASGFFQPVATRLGPEGSQALAYSGLLLGTLLLGVGTLFIFRRFFGKTLRFVDNALGGVVGLLVGALAFGLFALGVFHWEETRLHAPLKNSYIGRPVIDGTRVVVFLFPEDFRKRVEVSLSDRVNTMVGSKDDAAKPVPASHKTEGG